MYSFQREYGQKWMEEMKTYGLSVLSCHWPHTVKHLYYSLYVLHGVSDAVEPYATFYLESSCSLESEVDEAMNPCCIYNGLPNNNRTATVWSIPQLRSTVLPKTIRGVQLKKEATINYCDLGYYWMYRQVERGSISIVFSRIENI